MNLDVGRILQNHFPLPVRLVPMRSPGDDGMPSFLPIHPHAQADLLRHLCIVQVYRPLIIILALTHGCIAGPPAVQVVAKKCPPAIAQHLQGIGIPVILEPFPRQIHGRYHLLFKHALDEALEPFIRILCLVHIQHRIDSGQFFHMSICHFVDGYEHIISPSADGVQFSEHIRPDLLGITVEQGRLILPQFLGLVEHVLAEAFFIILHIHVLLRHAQMVPDSFQHLRHVNVGKRH